MQVDHHLVDARRVVSAGACIGCGGCSLIAEGGSRAMRFGNLQMYEPNVTEAEAPDSSLFQQICPFSGRSLNEDDLGRQHFGASLQYVDGLGYGGDLYAGHVVEEDFRASGSSGGLVSWVLTACLNRGMADHVIHVGRNPTPGPGDPLYRYVISSSEQEVRGRAGSMYYVVEMSEVLRDVRQRAGRYVFVGLPCMVKAVRLLQRVDPILAERIVLTVGLVCGHLKSGAFTEYYGWALAIPPGDLAAINFRKKQAHSTANDYGIEVRSKTGEARFKPSRDLLGGDWGLGFFKPAACDLCDDVFAETADLTIGDAWIKPYVKDPEGNNVVVCRHEAFTTLLNNGIRNGAIQLDRITPEAALKSQASGLRHRREGLSHRLKLKEERGEWAPRKRVRPGSIRVSRRRQRIYEMRIAIAGKSHTAFLEAKAKGSLEVFYGQMRPLLKAYYKLYKRDTRGSIWVRAIRAGLWRVKGWLGVASR